MRFSPVPDYAFKDLTDISPDFLQNLGVTILFLDLDNTIAPYGTDIPTVAISDWAEFIKRSGIELFIITNNHKSKRVESHASSLGIGYILGANKPSASGIRRALEQRGKKPHEAALAGDQVYTDVLAANRAGIISISVRPIKILNPALNIRFWLEAPFRAMCKNKMWK
jgi:HAD superfamily phosphatase (TIGR01668 family)